MADKKYAIRVGADRSRAAHYVAGLPGEYESRKTYHIDDLEAAFPGRVNVTMVRRLIKAGAPIELIELEQEDKPAANEPAAYKNTEDKKDDMNKNYSETYEAGSE